jgi:fibro-slime domain-containing protein
MARLCERRLPNARGEFIMSVVRRSSMLSAVCALSLACNTHVSQDQSHVQPTASSAGSAGTGATTGSGNIPNGAGGGAGTSISLNVDGGPDNSSAGSGGGVQIITTLPAGFTQTDMGGFQLGAPLGAAGSGGAGGSSGASGASGETGSLGGAAGVSGASSTAGGTSSGGAVGADNGNCGNVLVGVARDFRGANEVGGNPDFESASFWGNSVTLGIVAPTLGMDQKPVYASKCELGTASVSTACPYGPETTSQSNFDQWYRDTPNVDQPFLISLYLAPQPGGLFTFQSLHYFPLDNVGYGNSGKANDGLMHNFGFTTEIHTKFAYNGGETFQFQGDDDVWVFINGKMTVDLGGLHPAMLGMVSLDASATMLGIQKGSVYSLDLFHAERHTDKSTFRIDTNLSFVNCGTVEAGAPR